jgi:hypothetical protein
MPRDASELVLEAARTQELKDLAQACEGMDASGCWRELLHVHWELGRD